MTRIRLCLMLLFSAMMMHSAVRAQEGTITIQLESTPLADAVAFFADEIGVSILLDPSIESNSVTGQITNIPVMEAFEAILKANGLWYEANETGRIFLINQSNLSFSGRVTERIQVNFIDLETLETIVNRYTTNYIVDERTNSFVVTDTPPRIVELREVIAALDVPSKQVMIEVEIVAFDRNESQKLGFDWNFLGQIDGDSPIGAGRATGDFTPEGSLNITFGQYASGSLGGKNLLVTLEALEKNGIADILASPRIRTINRQAALISITEHTATGTRVVQSTISLGQTVTEPIYSDVGVTLSVTPAVAGDSLVVMDIVPTVSTARASPFFPTIAVDTQIRTTETTVMAKDNQTIAIGGLHQTNITENVAKVPILGHLPLLGYLFTQKSSEIRKTELVVFITPLIIDPSNMNILEEPIPTAPTEDINPQD